MGVSARLMNDAWAVHSMIADLEDYFMYVSCSIVGGHGMQCRRLLADRVLHAGAEGSEVGDRVRQDSEV